MFHDFDSSRTLDGYQAFVVYIFESEVFTSKFCSLDVLGMLEVSPFVSGVEDNVEVVIIIRENRVIHDACVFVEDEREFGFPGFLIGNITDEEAFEEFGSFGSVDSGY